MKRAVNEARSNLPNTEAQTDQTLGNIHRVDLVKRPQDVILQCLLFFRDRYFWK